MNNQQAAQTAFLKAREIYTGKAIGVRYKSSNKLHLDPSSSLTKDEKIRYDLGTVPTRMRTQAIRPAISKRSSSIAKTGLA